MGATEWTLTRENVYELRDLIDTSQLHHSYNPDTGRSELEGLEVWTLGDRTSTLARFGDTVRRAGHRWAVSSPAAGAGQPPKEQS